MVAEETKNVDTLTDSSSEAPPPLEPPKDVVDQTENTEKPAPPPSLPAPQDKPADDSALALVQKPSETAEEKKSENSIDRDAVLSRVATEKRLSLIKAWEESEKSKVENKAQKKLSEIGAWENSKKATIEAEIKQMEEKLVKQKAEYIEKMKNKIALIHKSAEEKRAILEAKKGEEVLKAEETAAKYCATGTAPKKLLGCF